MSNDDTGPPTSEAFAAWAAERGDQLARLRVDGWRIYMQARPGGFVLVVEHAGGLGLTYRTIEAIGAFVDGWIIADDRGTAGGNAPALEPKNRE